jgi:hypothetical protein
MKKTIAWIAVFVLAGSVFGMGRAPEAAPADQQIKATCGGPCAGSCGCGGAKAGKGDCGCNGDAKKAAPSTTQACEGGVCPLKK